jgi:hypothetical protein
MPKNVGLPALLRPTSKGGGPATTDSGNDLAALVPAHSLESQRRRVGASDEPAERLGQRLESFPGGAAATLEVLERSRRTRSGVVAKRAKIGNESLVPANVPNTLLATRGVAKSLIAVHRGPEAVAAIREAATIWEKRNRTDSDGLYNAASSSQPGCSCSQSYRGGRARAWPAGVPAFLGST